ncbi:MAG: 3-oxoacid CoA-transferase subunit A [Gammaproteobacteria bacterium]|nr:3-oxoacid CoA-transferase subunit A [Gammaproteobacteria bacterium]MBU1439767.1 3-oxoacid CoA-transferase subunit A [Gammaproteobacteria bacterium]MBU2286329.1 3-oxoacid CoA-transferase subunit A [Gammaproteobacteria bacterium]MBU2411073.1 3-oxoacid CoA-transferase subunit A [Gammaproteobacteria bacterium]
MIDKVARSVAEAIGDVQDGATVLVSGFGDAGMAHRLIEGLLLQGARDLTLVSNNVGNAETGLAVLLKAGRVRKVICSFPRSADSHVFDELYRDGQVELELVPQGTLAERIRAAGAGISGFYTRTAFGTPLADGKERRFFNGEGTVLELPIRGDLALIGAERGDRWGNLVYRKTARNFGPVMATAAARTVASVRKIVPLGGLDPEQVVTPGIFVHKLVQVAAIADLSATSA